LANLRNTLVIFRDTHNRFPPQIAYIHVNRLHENPGATNRCGWRLPLSRKERSGKPSGHFRLVRAA
jgi:hypothetical protein